MFGYPGGAIMPVYDELYKYQEKLHHVLVRHEQGATHAAQGYARASGRVGVAIATSGPGKLVGELGLIRNEPRALDMRAKSELTCLRIGAEEFLDVVGNDARTAYKLLQVVAGYVSN